MSVTALATSSDTDPQHLRALARANEVRLARAQLKRRIADGEITAAEVVRECPWEAASMPIADVLQSQHRWGVSRCRRFLLAFRISEAKTVGSLTVRQRVELEAALADAAGR